MTASPHPFVGRAAELTMLGDALAGARAGRGCFLLLVGEAGVGKTRTVEELVAREAIAPDAVWWGRCPEHRGAPAFWPWGQAIRAYVSQASDDLLRRDLAGTAADVALVVPGLRERLPGLEECALPGHEQGRFRLFAALTSLLARVAARTPLLIVLDDLHCADEESLQLLAHVSRELAQMQVLVVGAQRAERRGGDSSPLSGAVRSAARLISLRGLDLDETRALVRALAATEPAERVVDRLHRESAGNPSFIEETLHVLAAEGGVAPDDEAAGSPPSEGIRALIRRRTSQVDPSERQLLDLAAVLGREFDVASLQAASGLSASEVIGALAEGGASRFVVEVPDAVGRFRFLQASVRETLYRDLRPSERCALHRRVGLAMEHTHAGSADPPVGELAYHFFRAAPLGEAERALDYAERAGQHAIALLGHEAAVRHFETALQAASFKPGDGSARTRLLLSLGDAAWRAGDPAKARDAFARAARAATARGTATDLARAALGYGRASTETGGLDPVLNGLLEQALAALGDGDGALRAMVLARLSMALYFTGDEPRCDRLSQEAVAVARRVADPTALGAALINRHFVLWGPRGTTEERLALAREALQLGVDPAVRLEAQVWLVFDLLESGDVAAADLAQARFARESDAALLPTYLWHAALLRATRALLAGRFTEAEALAAAAAGPRLHDPLSVPAQFHCTQRFFVLREIGGLEALRAPLQAYVDAYPTLTTWRTGLMLFHAELAEDAAARAVFEQLAAREFADLPRDGLWLPALAQLADVAARFGDVSRGALLYDLLAPYAARNLIVAVNASCLGPVARYLGMLAHLLGRFDDAQRHFEAAHAMCARMGARPLAAHVQHDYARMLLARDAPGDRPRSDGLLADARRTADELGMTVLGKRLTAVANAPATTPPSWNAGASFREEGGEWVLVCGSETCRLRDTKGLQYLAVLLRHPNEEFHALELAQGRPSGATARRTLGPGDRPSVFAASDAGDMLDEAARAAYKRRLVDLREDEAEAQRTGDADRAEQIHEEIEALARELARAVGLRGRSRKAASDVERARLNVSRAIIAVVRKIAAESPMVGQHLTATVRTGTFCAYVPDPRLPVRWRL